MADKHSKPETRTIRSLQEFSETFVLPRSARVVGGKGLQSAPFKVGDFIHLHTLAVDNVSLKFYDTDGGSRREVKVPADSTIKFEILTREQWARRKLGQKVYPTIADLLDDCPPKFQANVEHSDPYLPIIFKKGEQFKFRRKIRSPNDRRLYLECEDSSGNVLLLPRSCRGDFSAIEDKTPYTLQEIVSFGAVPRTLRLSEENIKLALLDDKDGEGANDIHVYGNIKSQDDTLSRIIGLPYTFKGNIFMQKPEMFLIVSPDIDPEVKWKVPLDLDVQLLASADEIQAREESCKQSTTLEQFVTDHEQDFPVVARVTKINNNIPGIFQKYLKPNMDVLIHSVERVDKVMCRDSSKCFCFGDKTRGRFRKALRRFYSLLELTEVDPPLKAKIMEDIASDVPEPFSLSAGDELLFKHLGTHTVNIKLGKKKYGKCVTYTCEKILENGSKSKLHLPSDLDVAMIQMPNPGEESGFDMQTLFSRCFNLPLEVDYLPSDPSAQNVIPMQSEMVLEHFVTDHIAVVSPLPVRGNERRSGLDAKIEFCLLLPIRYDIRLYLLDCLQFPSNYFRFPPPSCWISMDTEILTDEDYQKMVTCHNQTYEDYDFRNNSLTSGSSDVPVDKTLKSSLHRMLRRKGRSMTELELKNLDVSPTKDNILPSRSRNGSDGNLQQSTNDDSDENIYESVKLGKNRNTKSRRSIGSRLRRRVSKIL